MNEENVPKPVAFLFAIYREILKGIRGTSLDKNKGKKKQTRRKKRVEKKKG